MRHRCRQRHWPTTSLERLDRREKAGKHESLDAIASRASSHNWLRRSCLGLAVHGQSKAANYVPPLVRPAAGHGNSRGARPLSCGGGTGDGVLPPATSGRRREARRTGPNGFVTAKPPAPGGVAPGSTHARCSFGLGRAVATRWSASRGRWTGTRPASPHSWSRPRHHPVEQTPTEVLEAVDRFEVLADVRRATSTRLSLVPHGHCRAPLPPGIRSRGSRWLKSDDFTLKVIERKTQLRRPPRTCST